MTTGAQGHELVNVADIGLQMLVDMSAAGLHKIPRPGVAQSLQEERARCRRERRRDARDDGMS